MGHSVMCFCLLCPESVVGSTSGVVCVRWHGNSMAIHGPWPYDLGQFPRVSHAVRRSSQTVRCSAARPDNAPARRHVQQYCQLVCLRCRHSGFWFRIPSFLNPLYRLFLKSWQKLMTIAKLKLVTSTLSSILVGFERHFGLWNLTNRSLAMGIRGQPPNYYGSKVQSGVILCTFIAFVTLEANFIVLLFSQYSRILTVYRLCFFTALHVMQTRYSEENSVCPSVCHTRDPWQNGREICPDFYTIRKNIYPSFLRRRMVGGGDAFYLKFWVNRPPLERNRRFSTNNRS